jgi:hypothetical protein
MAITVAEADFEPRSVSLGPVKFQLVTVTAAGGSTSGTLVATRLKELYHVILPGIVSQTAAAVITGNSAALSFTVPAAGMVITAICIGR